MQLKNYNVYFFFFVLIGVTALAYFIVKPFVIPFFLAVVLAHLFRPVYGFLSNKLKSKSLSSLLSCLFILLLIVIPTWIVITLVVGEVRGLVNDFNSRPGFAKGIIDQSTVILKEIPGFRDFNLSQAVSQESLTTWGKSLSQNILTILQGTYNGVIHLAFVLFAMFFSLFYLFIGGDKLLHKVMQLSPLREKHEEMLVAKFNSISRATVKGTVSMGLLHGILGGTLFALAGVPSPALLGILMAIASIIPPLGSGLIWIPAGILMMLSGNLPEGLVIVLSGAFIFGSIDNLLRPRLVGRDTQMHPLLILFSTIGGIALFGISGFIVGPIIMALFVAFWEIYALEFKAQLKEYN